MKRQATIVALTLVALLTGTQRLTARVTSYKLTDPNKKKEGVAYIGYEEIIKEVMALKKAKLKSTDTLQEKTASKFIDDYVLCPNTSNVNVCNLSEKQREPIYEALAKLEDKTNNMLKAVENVKQVEPTLFKETIRFRVILNALNVITPTLMQSFPTLRMVKYNIKNICQENDYESIVLFTTKISVLKLALMYLKWALEYSIGQKGKKENINTETLTVYLPIDIENYINGYTDKLYTRPFEGLLKKRDWEHIKRNAGIPE